jgi:3-oxoacyl-[acyl-carrier protein] reductase
MDRPVTLITGTSRGIGKFLVNHYVNNGHYVIGCSRSNVDWSFDNYEHFITDVADEMAVKHLFSSIRKKYSRLDNLINNAGVSSMNHCLLTPLATVNFIMNTNFVGTFLFCREAAKLMQRRKYGRIVNFSSIAVPLKIDGEAIYSASKAAIILLSQTLARELASYGITVNVIGPTPVETDLIRSVPKEKIDKLLALQAIRRLGTFEDIANVIDFYLDKKSDFITGQCIYLGGV